MMIEDETGAEVKMLFWIARMVGKLAMTTLLSFTPATSVYAQQPKLDPVSVRVDVFFYGAHVPILLGIVDGIYSKHGMDVTAAAGRGSATTIQTVANMSDQFGFADGGTLVKLTAQGLRAKQVLGILQTGSNAVMALPDSGITKPVDLNGKTTGFAPGGATDQLFPAFARKAGVDFKSIKGIAVDATTRDNLFLLKKIDFDLALAAAQLPILQEKCDCKLSLIRFSDYGLNLMSNGIVASDKLIAQNPDLVRRFVAATREAIGAAMMDPTHGVDDFFKYAPNAGVSRKVVSEQWQMAMALMRTKATETTPLGQMDASDWQSTIDLLVDYAGVPKGAVTPDMVFTNQFLLP
jgi:NitT/TauT family transport system substrate-binding protein